jgi:arabinofuranosyltransferase
LALSALLRLLLPFVAIVGAHYLWRHWYYGDWLPNTYYAKTGDLAGQLRTGLPYALDFLWRFILPLSVLVVAAAARDGATAVRSRPAILTAALLGAWLGYTIVVGGDMLGMFRFYAALLPVGLTFAAGMAAGSGWLGRARPAALLVVPLVAAQLFSSFQGSERRLVDIHMSEANLGGWILAGDAMAEQLPQGTTIALGPAGYIPWRTGFRTLDFYGIVTPAIARREAVFRHGYAGHEKTDGPWIVSRRPDYILLGNVDITDGPRTDLIRPLDREVDIVLDRRFQQEYEQVWLPVGDGKVLNLFRRRDLAR